MTRLSALSTLLLAACLALAAPANARADRLDYLTHYSGLNNNRLTSAPDGSLFTTELDSIENIIKHIGQDGSVLGSFRTDGGSTEVMGVTDLAANPSGSVFVARLGQGNGIAVCQIRKFQPDGTLLAEFDDCGSNTQSGYFNYRMDASSSIIAIADGRNERVRILDSNLDFVRDCSLAASPGAITVDDRDGSFYVALFDGQVRHYSQDCNLVGSFSSPGITHMSAQGDSLWLITRDMFEFSDVVHERTSAGETRAFNDYRVSNNNRGSVGTVQGFATTGSGDLWFSAYSTGLSGGDPALLRIGNVPSPTISIAGHSPNPNTASNAFIDYEASSLHGIYTSCKVVYDGVYRDNCVLGTGRSTLAAGSAGPHTFEVEACVDSDCDRDSYSFVQQGPTVTIDAASKPASRTSATDAAFTWETTGTISNTQCASLDGPFGDYNFHPCSEPFQLSNLGPGQHSFAVRVNGPAGTSTDTYTWTVEALAPPVVEIDAGSKPSNPTENTSASFIWDDSAGGPVETTECRVDGQAYASCSKPFAVQSLNPGVHSFNVRVTNAAGSDTDSYTWTVQAPPLDAPTVEIDAGSKPSNPTYSTSSALTWTESGQVDTRACEFDGQPVPCTEPVERTGLATGAHSFRITVGNASGSDTDSYTWTVSLLAPPPPPPDDGDPTPPPPVDPCEGLRLTSASPTSVQAGESVYVTGDNLTAVTSLHLNGQPLRIERSVTGGKTAILALIPAGARSGLIKASCGGTVRDPGVPVTIVHLRNLLPTAKAIASAYATSGRTLSKTNGNRPQGTRFELDGSFSSDPDGRIVRYRWTYKQKTLSSSSVFRYIASRKRRITLTVWDDKGASDSARVLLTPAKRGKKPPPAKPVTITIPGALFCFDCDGLSAQGKRVVRRAQRYVRGAKRVSLAGHTDNVGSHAYNQALSKRRVANVRETLLRGLRGRSKPRKLSARWFGEIRPTASNATSAGRAKNRRVTITVWR